MELTPGFVSLLEELRGVFNVQSFPIFVELMTGWVLSHRHRFVTDLIISSGSVEKRHFSNYHRFFSQYAWSLDVLSKHLLLLLVRVFAPTGVIELAIDDTLARKRGLMVYGTGMHHDPLMSSKAKTITSWGHDWVVLCLVIRLPEWAPTKVFSLPFCFRLYRNRQGSKKGKKKTPKQDPTQRKRAAKQRKQQKARNETKLPHRTRPELAVEMVQLVAGWLPDREFMVTGDSDYGGGSVLQKLPKNIGLISHVHPKGGLYDPAPKPKPGEKKGRGRGRKKGKRLPGMAQWAKDKTKWQTLKFDEYGFHATVKVKVIKERPSADHRAGAGHIGKTAGANVLLHRLAVERAPHSQLLCSEVVHRSHLPRLQAVAWLRRPSQPQGEGGSSHCTDGHGAVQFDCCLVSS